MIYLCDFEDSFTYNIYADLVEQGHKVELIKFKDVFKFLQTKINSQEKEIIILGPGPGHPNDYNSLFSSIKALLFRSQLLLVGICLGHQMIWTAMGHECSHCASPIHGQSVMLNLDRQWQDYLELDSPMQSMQFYNSLCIKLSDKILAKYRLENNWMFFVKNNELIMSANTGVLTYQFHPESVGTSCQKSLYSPIRRFLIQ